LGHQNVLVWNDHCRIKERDHCGKRSNICTGAGHL